ncbi:MAG: hypothetical protein Q9184_005956, partial [Pyrenodesmia sp. 2 TL-2023]
MSSNSLDLDWRNAAKTTAIILEIRRLLTKIDQGPTVDLRLESSTAPNIISLQTDNGVPMLKRRDYKSQRRSASNAQYWARLLKTATLLNNMVVERMSLKMRFIQFREPPVSFALYTLHQFCGLTIAQAGKHEPLDLIKHKVNDIALTLGIHPAAFGIQQQEGGTIKTPDGVSLDNIIVTNIFDYNDRQRSGPIGKEVQLPGTQQLRLHGQKPIPSLVLDVNVKQSSNSKIDAVVVVEHRNLSELGLKDVLLVMTGGFPSSATKEYLHLLSQSTKLQDVPFLYFGDHDMQGMTIFQTLKYGSKNAAWGSKTMVCPQLSYAGPTRQELKESVQKFRPQWEARFRAEYPDEDDEVVEAQADRWQRKTKNKVDKKFAKHTQKDTEIKRGFEKLGWLEYEPLVKTEVNYIIDAKRGGKFRLADMTIVDLDYLRYFIEAKLAKACKNRVAMKVKPPVARGVRLQNTPSQFSSVPLGARNQASPEDLEMETADPAESQAP